MSVLVKGALSTTGVKFFLYKFKNIDIFLFLVPLQWVSSPGSLEPGYLKAAPRVYSRGVSTLFL